MTQKIISSGVNEIDKYCRDILSGEIPSCNYIYKAVERFQDDLKRSQGDDYPFYFEPKACNHFFEFVEQNLKHFQSPFAGDPVIFENWQKFVFGQIFGWLKKEKIKDKAVRRFRTANIFIAKKNGKSFIGAVIALYFLLYEGNGTEIYSLAMNRNHAKKLSFNTAVQMIQNSEELQELFNVNNSIASLGIKCGATQSFFEPISSKPNTADGINPNLILNDEVKDALDFELYDTLVSGAVTRLSPLILNISSAGHNTASVGYELFQHSENILKGELEDETTLAIIYTIDDEDQENWDQLDVWLKANPNLGVSIAESYVEQRISTGRENARVRNEIITKNLNKFGKSSKGWLDIEKWDACKDDQLSIDDVSHLPAVIAIDISSKLDLTNIKITFFDGSSMGDYHIYPFDFFYLPESRLSNEDSEHHDRYKSKLKEWKLTGDIFIAGDETINQDILKNKTMELCKTYDVQKIAFDPWHSEGIVQALQKAGVDKDLFIEYTQVGYRNFHQPMTELESMIISNRVHHNGNQVQRWCMENVGTKENEYESIRPIKISSDRKIDGAVTLIMTVGSLIWGVEPNKKKRKLSPIAERFLNNQKQH